MKPNSKSLEDWNVPDGIEVVSKEDFVKLSPEAIERYNAYLKEVRRLESIYIRSQKSKLKKTKL